MTHEKHICGIWDMKDLAEMVGDLHYHTLRNFLSELSRKLERDSRKDFEAGREKLADALQYTSMSLFESALRMDKAWEISKPFMKEE